MTFPHYPKSREIYSHTGLRGVAAMNVFLFHMYQGQHDGVFRLIDWGGGLRRFVFYSQRLHFELGVSRERHFHKLDRLCTCTSC